MVKIVTDSSCDISPQRCAELGVEMLPITVNFGGESYRANLDISNEEFYEKLAAAEELPHTAQITPAQFQEIFKPYQESGDDVVCLFISSQMSGTLQSARVAANILGGGQHPAARYPPRHLRLGAAGGGGRENAGRRPFRQGDCGAD